MKANAEFRDQALIADGAEWRQPCASPHNTAGGAACAKAGSAGQAGVLSARQAGRHRAHANRGRIDVSTRSGMARCKQLYRASWVVASSGAELLLAPGMPTLSITIVIGITWLHHPHIWRGDD